MLLMSFFAILKQKIRIIEGCDVDLDNL